MGWERKRGKLHELNALLRGATDDRASSRPAAGVDRRRRASATSSRSTPTRGCRAARSSGWSARWPIRSTGRASIARRGRVVEGYGVLQPRVTPTLPAEREALVLPADLLRLGRASTRTPPRCPTSTRTCSARARYTGKGIYDVDAFEAALAGRVPENALLSHDLFEGIFARAGLVTDVELFDEFPSDYLGGRGAPAPLGARRLAAAAVDPRRARAHGRRVERDPAIGRWKMLDNLRRTLSAPLALRDPRRWPGSCPPVAGRAVDRASSSRSSSCPPALPVLAGLLPRRRGISKRSHLRAVGRDVAARRPRRSALGAHVPRPPGVADGRRDRADARRGCTSRAGDLLEWATAAQAKAEPRPRPRAASIGGWPAASRSAVAAAGGRVVCRAGAAWLVARRSSLLWLAVAGVARWVSLPPRHRRADAALSAADVRRAAADRPADLALLRDLRRRRGPLAAARQLPGGPAAGRRAPHLADQHRAVPARRPSAARDFGWIGTARHGRAARGDAGDDATSSSASAATSTTGTTRATLRPLEPTYVSTVDSGNLAGHLLALANACREMVDAAAAGQRRARRHRRRAGARPATPTARRDGAGSRRAGRAERARRGGTCDEPLERPASLRRRRPTQRRPAAALRPSSRRRTPATAGRARASAAAAERGAESRRRDAPLIVASTAALADSRSPSHVRRRTPAELAERRARAGVAATLVRRLQRARRRCAARWSTAMDFGFLFDPARKLFSIGYRVDRRQRSTRAATTCSPPRRGSRASSRSPRATSPPSTGSGSAAR